VISRSPVEFLGIRRNHRGTAVLSHIRIAGAGPNPSSTERFFHSCREIFQGPVAAFLEFSSASLGSDATLFLET